jgi:hypothetical protein
LSGELAIRPSIPSTCTSIKKTPSSHNSTLAILRPSPSHPDAAGILSYVSIAVHLRTWLPLQPSPTDLASLDTTLLAAEDVVLDHTPALRGTFLEEISALFHLALSPVVQIDALPGVSALDGAGNGLCLLL